LLKVSNEKESVNNEMVVIFEITIHSSHI